MDPENGFGRVRYCGILMKDSPGPTGDEHEQVIGKKNQSGGTEGVHEQWPLRTIAQDLLVLRRDRIKGVVCFLKFLLIFAMKELTTGGISDAFQRSIIDFVFARRVWIANSHNMNQDAALLGDAGCLLWRHSASGVVAVGQQDEDSLLGIARFKLLDCQADGVAYDGLRPRHSGFRLTQHLKACAVIQGERSNRVSRRTKDDQTNAVADTFFDERTDDLFHGLHT